MLDRHDRRHSAEPIAGPSTGANHQMIEDGMRRIEIKQRCDRTDERPASSHGTSTTLHPSLSFDVTWLAAREERMLDENLLSVGRRSALERMAYVLLHLFRRAEDPGLTEGDRVEFRSFSNIWRTRWECRWCTRTTRCVG